MRPIVFLLSVYWRWRFLSHIGFTRLNALVPLRFYCCRHLLLSLLLAFLLLTSLLWHSVHDIPLVLRNSLEILGVFGSHGFGLSSISLCSVRIGRPLPCTNLLALQRFTCLFKISPRSRFLLCSARHYFPFFLGSLRFHFFRPESLMLR